MSRDTEKQQWALETGQLPTVTPTTVNLNPYVGRMGNGNDLYCPLVKGTAWGGYSAGIGAVSDLPTCANWDSSTANSGKHAASLDPAKQ